MELSAISSQFADLPAWAQTLTGLAILVVAATISNELVKRVIIVLIERGLENLSPGDGPLDVVVRRIANILPAIVISKGVALVPHLPPDAITVTRNVVSAFIVLSIVLAISAALNFVNQLYQRRPDAASRPIKGYVQLAKILIFGFGAILIVAALMEQSPLLLLSGLGAMAAVLLLVFKDTILSLVASVQLTSNDMLRVGDWIEMPQLNADGDVIDIALHTVKVQNWDKTITSIPTHRLIAESFKNWRGMAQSGGRRIKRSLYLDQNSVRFVTRDEDRDLARLTLLGPYLEGKRKDIDRWNGGQRDGALYPVERRELTNIGTFRAYVQAYIDSHPRIRKDMTSMVRQLEPGPDGLPIEIYCFTDTVDWSEYEGIQADIFDHLLAILPNFGLRLLQRPGGMDVRDLSNILHQQPERLSYAG